MMNNYKYGGGIENENAEMVMNNNNQIKHHTEELEKIVTPETEVPAWVVSKVGRSASDLSDATHYLDGVSKIKYADGGGVEDDTQDKIDELYVYVINEADADELEERGITKDDLYLPDEQLKEKVLKSYGWILDENDVNGEYYLRQRVLQSYYDIFSNEDEYAEGGGVGSLTDNLKIVEIKKADENTIILDVILDGKVVEMEFEADELIEEAQEYDEDWLYLFVTTEKYNGKEYEITASFLGHPDYNLDFVDVEEGYVREHETYADGGGIGKYVFTGREKELYDKYISEYNNYITGEQPRDIVFYEYLSIEAGHYLKGNYNHGLSKEKNIEIGKEIINLRDKIWATDKTYDSQGNKYANSTIKGGAISRYRLVPYKERVKGYIESVGEKQVVVESTYEDASQKAVELLYSERDFVTVDIVKLGKSVLSSKKIAKVNSQGIVKYADGGGVGGVKEGQIYHIDSYNVKQYEGERVVDDVTILETPIGKTMVLVHSQKLGADVLVPIRELFKKYADGGSIPNNYEGKAVRHIWNSWSVSQRKHFLLDHNSNEVQDSYGEYRTEYLSEVEIENIAEVNYEDLPQDIKTKVFIHTDMGQYADGGGVGFDWNKAMKIANKLKVIKDKLADARTKGDSELVKKLEKEHEYYGSQLDAIYSNGGVVKYYTQENERLGRPSGSIEREILAKVEGRFEPNQFVGNFGWKTPQGKLADGYLYNLDDFDKSIITQVKLKDGESLFRYFNRTSAIGGMTPMIKINLNKGLLYFGVENENDDIVFETRGVNALYIGLIENKYADGGGVGKKLDWRLALGTYPKYYYGYNNGVIYATKEDNIELAEEWGGALYRRIKDIELVFPIKAKSFIDQESYMDFISLMLKTFPYREYSPTNGLTEVEIVEALNVLNWKFPEIDSDTFADGGVAYNPVWAEMEAYSPYSSRSEYENKKEYDDLAFASKSFSKSAEILVKENLMNGEICICKLRKILGHEPAYPIQYVGSIKLTKCFLKPFYKI